jgi:hypothetical protein
MPRPKPRLFQQQSRPAIMNLANHPQSIVALFASL